MDKGQNFTQNDGAKSFRIVAERKLEGNLAKKSNKGRTKIRC